MRTYMANRKEAGGRQGCFVASFAVLAVCLISCAVGYMWGWTHSRGVEARTIAYSLGDSMSGDLRAFYGARVYYEPLEPERTVVVKLAVEIGPGNGYFYGPVDLGRAASAGEARVKWRKIEWTKDALLVGEGPDQYSLSRTSLESHR